MCHKQITDTPPYISAEIGLKLNPSSNKPKYNIANNN